MGKKKRVLPPWHEYFYVTTHGSPIFLELFFVRCRETKKCFAGGFSEKEDAIKDLNKNWQKYLDEKVDDMLLVNK